MTNIYLTLLSEIVLFKVRVDGNTHAKRMTAHRSKLQFSFTAGGSFKYIFFFHKYVES